MYVRVCVCVYTHMHTYTYYIYIYTSIWKVRFEQNLIQSFLLRRNQTKSRESDQEGGIGEPGAHLPHERIKNTSTYGETPAEN